LISEYFAQSSCPETKFFLGRVANILKETGFGSFSRIPLSQRFLSLLFCQLFYAFEEVFLFLFLVFSGRGDLNNPAPILKKKAVS